MCGGKLRQKNICIILVFCIICVVWGIQNVSAVTQRIYQGQFADVPTDTWYYDYVSAAYEVGVIDGTSDNQYNPDGYVTVAECIKLASCIAQIKTEGKIMFQGDSQLWYKPYVQYALENGILTEACTDYEVYAERAWVVQMFSKILPEDEKPLNTSGSLYFRDVTNENTWYYGDVYRMYEYGIMVGDDTYCFHPEEQIRRSEMAAVVVRMLDKEKRVSHCFRVPDEIETAILMYHNFAESPADYTVTPMTFRSHLRALREEGYESITFEELILYTEGKIALPEKCVLLTSDDGYSSVLDIALPLLEEFDMKMSVAVIGEWIGNRGDGTLSHFTLDEVTAADTEGRIELVSHSWGLHAIGSYLNGAVNLAMTDKAYTSALQADCEKIWETAGDTFPMMKKVFVYPYGKYSAESETYLADVGYKVTVTVEQGVSHISVGDSLRLLKRIPAEWYVTGEQLLGKLR